MDGLLVFAFDGFGGPFAIGRDGVVTFDPETAEIAPLTPDMEGWAQALLDDYEMLTGHPLVRAWQIRHRALQPHERLTPPRPFTLGGGFDVENLQASDLGASLIHRARPAAAIRDLPDGATLPGPLPTNA